MTIRKKMAIIGILCPLFSFAQESTPIDTRGDMYYEAECYMKAFGEYMKAYTKRPDDNRLIRRIAETILKDEMVRSAAIPFIERYIKTEPTLDADIYFLAARAYFHAYQFDTAEEYLEKYKKESAANQDNATQLGACINTAREMLKDTLKCTLINMGENINTPFSEINPFIMNHCSTLVYSADDKYNSMMVMNYFNVKTSESHGLVWSKGKPVTGMVNTLYDEYVVGLSGDGIIFNSNRDGEFAIYESERYMGNGRMSDGERFVAPIDMAGHEVGGTRSWGGDTLIFSATCDNGKLDLFYSIRLNETWQEPRPLPGKINMYDYDENYPNLSADGKRLYFSSDRPGTMGGFDLYYSDFDEKNSEWGEPVHLKYPLNDTYDNLTISFTPDQRYAYISAIKDGGFGGRDIYCAVFDNVLPNTALIKCAVSVKAKPRPMLLNEQPFIEVTDEDGEVVAALKMKMSNSTFILALDPGVYTLTIETDNTKTYTEKITIAEKYYNPQIPIEKLIVLDPQ